MWNTKRLLFVFLLVITPFAVAGPWFTGPLLAPAGHTIPRNHVNVEPYLFFTDVKGIFNRHGNIVDTPGNQSMIFSPVVTFGLTDNIDLQYSAPYIHNDNKEAHAARIGDVAATLGYQLIEQKNSLWIPNLRVTLQEIIPTGRFKQLEPTNNGTDSTGLGSYQTAFDLNFQHLLELGDTHYLRTRLSLGYILAANTHIDGVSSYGGTPMTSGTVNPGNMLTIDLAGELTLTQNWVAVMEAFASKRDRSIFKGFPGFLPNGQPAPIGYNSIKQMTLAPAIEYNFNSNVGVIGGVWLTVDGQETADFTSGVIAINLFW